VTYLSGTRPQVSTIQGELYLFLNAYTTGLIDNTTYDTRIASYTPVQKVTNVFKVIATKSADPVKLYFGASSKTVNFLNLNCTSSMAAYQDRFLTEIR